MKRRSFLKIGAAAVASTAAAQAAFATTLANFDENIDDGDPSPLPEGPEHEPRVWSCEGAVAGPEDLSLKFLGTGSAGWKPGSTGRRHSSVLLDGKVLIDLTISQLDTLGDVRPKTIFYTHTHADHFQPDPAMKVGVEKAYVSETVVDYVREQFAKAGASNGLPVPEVIPLKLGQKVEVEGLVFTALPANHMTGVWDEQTQIYLIEKGTTDTHLGVRLLYATDTGGIVGRAARIVGLDPHIKPGRPITGFIMESTYTDDADFRIFVHSGTSTVKRYTDVLLANGRLTMPEGQPVYMTHMSKSLHPTQEVMDRTLPDPLRAAYDGLETVFRAME